MGDERRPLFARLEFAKGTKGTKGSKGRPDAGQTPADIAALIADAVAPALLQHCCRALTFLSRFLPSLFSAVQR